MINITTGRFWDEGIKLVSGCTRCSEGCKNCWSLAMDKRFSPAVDESLIVTHPDRLKRFNKKKPTVYALWNDWCHDGVPYHFQQSMVNMTVIHECHTILALTKRPQNAVVFFMKYGSPPVNWWSGLTVVNQQEADEKIPIFLQVPGKKFLSIEPMLGEINLHLSDVVDNSGNSWGVRHNFIDAVILGGETGPGARPSHPDWVRSVRDQCAAAGVPFFFKNWGYWIPVEELGTCRFEKNKTHSRILDMETYDSLPWVPK